MTIWRVFRCYLSDDTIKYVVVPHDLIGHLKCCCKWLGFKGLKGFYLFKKQAERKASELNKQYIEESNLNGCLVGQNDIISSVLGTEDGN